MNLRLSICLFIPDDLLAQSITSFLSGDRYTLTLVSSAGELFDFVKKNQETIDCLLVLNHPTLLPILNQLYEQGTLVPAILIEAQNGSDDEPSVEFSENLGVEVGIPTYFYHSAEVRLLATEIVKISSTIDLAIGHFLHLGPSCSLSEKLMNTIKTSEIGDRQSFLLLQQTRLAQKLKERLGYLGVYYKRNSQYFYRNLSQTDKQKLLEQLYADYREILLNYFSQEDELVNSTIDGFVNNAFFSDMSASQILEIHMELMDEFSQQLKLEGRSEDILQDYRLALIDILAHLGEMYRRSIPREDIPFELLYRMD
ncbi:MAG: circadian clock protein KaiA [Hydrococcus sp. CSU_1_8]|nr:circadian clock protein KaiA [Hydrococcus sp. CSU_1_8]